MWWQYLLCSDRTFLHVPQIGRQRRHFYDQHRHNRWRMLIWYRSSLWQLPISDQQHVSDMLYILHNVLWPVSAINIPARRRNTTLFRPISPFAPTCVSLHTSAAYCICMLLLQHILMYWSVLSTRPLRLSLDWKGAIALFCRAHESPAVPLVTQCFVFMLVLLL